ncbi:hypothetical protein GCM10020000_66590 [Streptomyces olivoverticillatus]
MEFTVAHAPGHTKGSVTFRMPESPDVPSVFFSGDLLFAGSIGRTDLPGGDHAEMLQSLARVCLPLDDSTVVLSGHGPPDDHRPRARHQSLPPGRGRLALEPDPRLRDEECDESFREHLQGPPGHLRPDPAGLRGLPGRPRGHLRPPQAG